MDRRGFISSIIAATVASQIEGSELPVTVDDIVAEKETKIVIPEIDHSKERRGCCSG